MSDAPRGSSPVALPPAHSDQPQGTVAAPRLIFIVEHDSSSAHLHQMSDTPAPAMWTTAAPPGGSTAFSSNFSNHSSFLGDPDDGGGSGDESPYSWYTKDWPLLKQTPTMTVVLSVAYLLVLLLGVVNNALVISVIYRNPAMRTVTNCFIANLAVADMLVSIFVLPITLLHNIFTEWWYGPFVCKAAPYLQGVAVSASVNTLAAVAIERYLAIFYPQTNRMTHRAACIMIGIIWLLPMCIFVPWIVVYIQKTFEIKGHTYVTCTADWKNMENRKMYTLGAVFLTCYLIPLVFIAIFYLLIGVRVYKRKVHGIRGSRAERNINRSKTRILRMLIVVFVTFALSWLPLYCIELRILFGSTPGHSEKILLKNILIPIAQWLGASNSCVNPFIYCYFSTNFRSGIWQVIRSGTCCGKISS